MPPSSPELDPRFSGISRLYGAAGLARFQAAHLTVVGVGGVGSWAAEALARSGIGRLTLVDLDDLCLTNTNRQIHALTETVGKPKVKVMAERIRLINPACEVIEKHTFYSEKSCEEILAPPLDGVIDAIDSIRAKCRLIATCRRQKIPLIVSGGAGGRRNPGKIESADLSKTHGDALLLQVRRNLRADYGFPSGEKRIRPFGIPAVFSSEQPVYPDASGGITNERPEDLPAGIRCEAGFGTATHITATFGLFAAGLLLDRLATEATQ
jgi:tRNA A37 threonylcarbamoyladenosine dehydratase